MPTHLSTFFSGATCGVPSLRDSTSVVLEITGGFVLVDKCDLEKLSAYRWHMTPKGYAMANDRSGLRPTSIAMHRFLLDFPSLEVDHRDGCRNNNTRANLRLATDRQNRQNQTKVLGRSGLKGVYRKGNRWIAQIKSHGVSRKCGSFMTAVEAAHAYDRAALELFGQYACTNASLGLLPANPPSSR